MNSLVVLIKCSLMVKKNTNNSWFGHFICHMLSLCCTYFVGHIEIAVCYIAGVVVLRVGSYFEAEMSYLWYRHGFGHRGVTEWKLN